MKLGRTHLIALFVICGAPLFAAEVPSVPETSIEGTKTSERIEQFGSVFTRIRSLKTPSVETEEYVYEGETLDGWTRLLAFQRISTAEPIGTDQYVGLLQRHIAEVPSAPRIRVVQQGAEASIFGVHYPSREPVDEQFGLVLVTRPDERRPNELHLVQLVLNPRKLKDGEMEALVRRWQARFQSQAASLTRKAQ